MRTSLHVPDRREAHAALAERRAHGELIIPPWMLDKEARRRHVRETLLEDHQHRIQHVPEAVAEKFAKLASSPYRFFRGTALLFYRDLAGADCGLPVVLAMGDVHPENFGVMPSADDTPIFGLNDFDEAYFAPFTFDLRRGAVGFAVAACELGHGKAGRKKIMRCFARGYLRGLEDFAHDERETQHQFRIDNSPPIIRGLLESACRTRKEFLQELLDPETGHFAPTDEVVPKSSRVADLQAAITQYEAAHPALKKHDLEVIDVALKTGSGTASLGLPRWFVLVRSRGEPDALPRVLELKRARVSALMGLVPDALTDGKTKKAARVVRSQTVHLVGGDTYFGHTELDGDTYVVRERSPLKKTIKLSKLDQSELRAYAEVCGWTLAQSHARSDEDTGIMEGNAERAILDAVRPELFVEDLARYGERRLKQLLRDFRLFNKDLALGAFDLPTSRLPG